MSTLPPGPRGLRAVLRLVGGFRNDPLDTMLGLARTYGDLVHYRLGPYRFYQANHPDLVREVLVSKGKSFRKVERFKKVFAGIDGKGLINSEGDFWLRQRRLVQPAFHSRRMGRYAEVMVEHARRLAGRWQAGEVLDVAEAMTHLTLEITVKTFFDEDLTGEAARLADAVRAVSQAIVREFNQPFLLPDWLPLPGKARKRRAVRTLDGFIRGMIRRRREAGVDRGDLLSMLLLAVDEEGDGSGMSDEQARDEAMTLFNAGHDSTAAALAWIWYLLGRHPEVEARLAEEVSAALGGRPATWEDLPRLGYAERVAKEALRIYPPTYALFPREPIEEVEVGGYRLTRGAWVNISPYVLHHDPRWFPEPERFDPDRFAPGRVEQIPPYAFLPFGAGPHVCIGNAFALMEMTLVMATVVQHCRLELAPGQEEAGIEPLVALRPRGGLRMKVSPRPVPAGSPG